MSRSQRVREVYASLTPEQRARVDAILAPALADGWIPKPTDIEEAIAKVEREGFAQTA